MPPEHDPPDEPAVPATTDEPLVSPRDESASGPPPTGFGPPIGEVAPAQRADDSRNMLPQRDSRHSPIERLFVRLIATCGIVAIGVAIAAIMVSNNAEGWLIGLVVSIVSVVLAAILWSSRQL